MFSAIMATLVLFFLKKRGEKERKKERRNLEDVLV